MINRLIMAVSIACSVPYFAAAQEHELMHHHVSLIQDAAVMDGQHPEASYSVGIEYEYRFSAVHGLFGVGPLLEVETFEDPHFVSMMLLIMHPIAGLKLGAGAGVEVDHHTPHPIERIFTGYDFLIGHVTVGPDLAVDFVDHHHVFLAGMAVGYEF